MCYTNSNIHWFKLSSWHKVVQKANIGSSDTRQQAGASCQCWDDVLILHVSGHLCKQLGKALIKKSVTIRLTRGPPLTRYLIFFCKIKNRWLYNTIDYIPVTTTWLGETVPPLEQEVSRQLLHVTCYTGHESRGRITISIYWNILLPVMYCTIRSYQHQRSLRKP